MRALQAIEVSTCAITLTAINIGMQGMSLWTEFVTLYHQQFFGWLCHASRMCHPLYDRSFILSHIITFMIVVLFYHISSSL